MIADTLATRLRAAREAAGLTQVALAAKVTPSTIAPGQISAWEAGKRTPTVDVLRRLAAALGVTVGSLVD